MSRYFCVNDDYFDLLNHKRTRLMLTLGHTADIYPIRMWRALFATSLRKRVLCDRFRSIEELELICGWSQEKGEAGKLGNALIACGFVEKDGLVAHGFKDGINGQHITDYLEQAQKKAAQRARTSETVDTSPSPIAGLVRAFHFCASPGIAAKSAAISDLIRQGVAQERIIAAANDITNHHLPFYEIIKSMQKLNGPAVRESGVEKWARLKEMEGKKP